MSDEDDVLACPHCDSPSITKHVGGMHRPTDDPLAYRCRGCGETFAEPTRRPRKTAPAGVGRLSDAGRALVEADPDDFELRPDGGYAVDESLERIRGTWGDDDPAVLAFDDASEPVVADVAGQLKYITAGHVGPSEIDREQCARLFELFGPPRVTPLSTHAHRFDRDIFEWELDRELRTDGGTDSVSAYSRVTSRIVRAFARWGLVRHPYGREYARETFGVLGGESR